MTMSQADMEKLAKTVARETVAETFTSLGLNIADPISVQGQFAFLRNLYHGARHMRNVAITAAGGLIVTGMCWAVWISIKAPPAVAVISH